MAFIAKVKLPACCVVMLLIYASICYSWTAPLDKRGSKMPGRLLRSARLVQQMAVEEKAQDVAAEVVAFQDGAIPSAHLGQQIAHLGQQIATEEKAQEVASKVVPSRDGDIPHLVVNASEDYPSSVGNSTSEEAAAIQVGGCHCASLLDGTLPPAEHSCIKKCSHEHRLALLGRPILHPCDGPLTHPADEL
eukprot:TRINITY_DN11956_c0_g1_i1.p1 TRINITY_DN11956_c0_g1~~TRINITY_DN11956_c0_g1_i1.p1  ORF type:complete len:216 (+),score=32.42 TRINITY_DN11956_c0_g1_i1:77-649(+)